MEALPYSKVEVICKLHDSLDYDVTFQDGKRPSELSQDSANNYLDAEETAFASVENSSVLLQEKFLSSIKRTQYVSPESIDEAPAEDNDLHSGATRHKTGNALKTAR